MAGNMIVETRMKEYAREKAGNTVKFSGDAVEILEKKVKELIDGALHRSKENGRVTVQAQDF
jgi:histone H3/H4